MVRFCVVKKSGLRAKRLRCCVLQRMAGDYLRRSIQLMARGIGKHLCGAGGRSENGKADSKQSGNVFATHGTNTPGCNRGRCKSKFPFTVNAGADEMHKVLC